jgi:hypothetical protein
MARKTNAFALGIFILLVLPFALADVNGGPVFSDPCGNGILESPEQCDGSNFGGASCSSLYGAGWTGTPSCSAQCTFTSGSCVAPITTITTTTSDGGSSGGGGGSGGSSSSKSSCTENWVCGNWSDCDGETQTRNCVDANKCKTLTLKPAETRTCVLDTNSDGIVDSPASDKGFFSFLTGAVIGAAGKAITWIILALLILLGLAYWFIAGKKKKNDADKPVKVKTLSEVRAANKAKAASKVKKK